MRETNSRQARLEQTARAIYCSWTPDDPSVRQLAALSELPYHFVWRRYPDREQARRKTLEPWIRELGLKAAVVPPQGSSLHARLTTIARQTAQFFASDEYRLMLFLVVRDAPRYPWLRTTYSRQIIAPMRRMLEDAIANYGRRIDRYTSLRKGAADRFLAELETAFALRTLRPETTDIARKEAIILRCVNDLLETVDVLDLSNAA